MPEKPGYDGSTALKSVMQELFVTSLLAGINQQDAYRNAYKTRKSKDNVIAANASELVRKPNVSIRLAYKRALLAKKAEITEEGQIKRFQHLSQKAEDLKQIASAISAEDKIKTICGLYEKDNKQKQGKSIVEILAIVANAKRQRQLQGSEVDSKGLNPVEATIMPEEEAIIDKENQ